MKTLVVAPLLLLLSGLSAAECIPPLDPDDLMLAVFTPKDESGRGDGLEIFSNGRVRVVFGCRELETWLESWVVEQISRSLEPVFFQRIGPKPTTMPSQSSEITLTCFDTEGQSPRRSTFSEQELHEPALTEVERIRSWLVSRVHREADLPLWGSWAWPPFACQLEFRRDSGLGVEEPAWCDVYLYSDLPGLLFPASHTKEQIRQQLLERLKNLPRGLQDAGENPNN